MANKVIKLKNTPTDVLDKVDAYLTASMKTKSPRSYLGGSYIGTECERELWYKYHLPKNIEDPRIIRIMDMGHMLESYCVALLKHSGYEVFYEDENGKQFGFEDGIFKGNIDAVILIDGEAHLLEIKSANDKRFSEMVKVGVESSDPVYYHQVQSYMHNMDLKKCLFFVINKNTCEIHTEIIDYNRMSAEHIIKRGKEIVLGDIPDRKYKTKAFFRCKMCSYNSECWGE